jgi:CRISPR-associated endoribonuclease Cas6
MAEYLQYWSENPTMSLAWHQLDRSLVYSSCQIQEALSYETFSRKFYHPAFQPPEKFTLVFNSPTTFNWSVNEHYLPLPDPRLILTSLYSKWNAFSGKLSLEDDDLLDHFLKALRVRYVQTQNASAMISRHSIPCFRGELGLSLSRKTPQPLRQLLMMLCCYAEYSGVGAKTAMGLGDVSIVTHAKVDTDLSHAQKEECPL